MAKNPRSEYATNFAGVPGLYRDRDPHPDPSNAAYYGAVPEKGDRTIAAGLYPDAGLPPSVAIPAGRGPFANLSTGHRTPEK